MFKVLSLCVGSQGAGEGKRHPKDASVWRHLIHVESGEKAGGTPWLMHTLMVCPTNM